MGHVSGPTTEPIRLHFTDQTRVVVTPEDEDRFMTTAAEAARACRHVQDILKWKQEFDGLLRHVNEWCQAKVERVSSAYMTFSDDGLRLFLLSKGSGYRFDLDDMVSELDIEICNKFELCPTEVSHFPEAPIESLSSFFDAGQALQVYGH